MIRLQKLAKRFGSFEAVRGIDLEIPSGQLVGLLGPNGAGKSTTLKMLTGTLVPTSGTAEIDGFDVAKDPLAVKKILGYVPETGAVFEALTGREYLELVAALHGIPENEVDALSEWTMGTVLKLDFEAGTVQLKGSKDTFPLAATRVVVLTSKDGGPVELPAGLGKTDIVVGGKEVFLPK